MVHRGLRAGRRTCDASSCHGSGSELIGKHTYQISRTVSELDRAPNSSFGAAGSGVCGKSVAMNSLESRCTAKGDAHSSSDGRSGGIRDVWDALPHMARHPSVPASSGAVSWRSRLGWPALLGVVCPDRLLHRPQSAPVRSFLLGDAASPSQHSRLGHQSNARDIPQEILKIIAEILLTT
jgi:hypothetical protein